MVSLQNGLLKVDHGNLALGPGDGRQQQGSTYQDSFKDIRHKYSPIVEGKESEAPTQ